MKLDELDKEVIRTFKRWLKEHDSACIEWRNDELLMWVEADDIRSFSETFGIQDDYTLECTLMCLDTFCFKVEDFMGGYGFDMTALLKRRESEGV